MNKFASLTSGLLARKGTAEPAATTYAEELLKRVDATGPDFRTYGFTGSAAANAAAPSAPNLPRRRYRGHDAFLLHGSGQDLPRQPAPQAQALCQAQACFCASAPTDAGHRQRSAGRMVRQVAARRPGRLRVHARGMKLSMEVNTMVTITRPDDLESCRGPPGP
jgi:hypothetical protein